MQHEQISAPSVSATDCLATPLLLSPPKALYILDPSTAHLIYGPQERKELEHIADFYDEPQTRQSIVKRPDLLELVEVIFSGWGGPIMDAAFIKAAPNLKAVFHGAGTIRPFTSKAFWERGIIISSAYAANAIPVAEYTLGVILLSLKKFWKVSMLAKQSKGWEEGPARDFPGGFRRTIALLGCGIIARKLIELLKSFDLQCIVFDPFLSDTEAARLGVELCSLKDAFQKGDVVSLHAPDIPETQGMITGELLSLMKRDATFINTARAPLVRHDEMVEVLSKRPDLTAILDVCHPDPEPPPQGAPVLALSNVIITPHIAGSQGQECHRMGLYMVDEFRRYLSGEPLRWQITRELAARMA